MKQFKLTERKTYLSKLTPFVLAASMSAILGGCTSVAKEPIVQNDQKPAITVQRDGELCSITSGSKFVGGVSCSLLKRTLLIPLDANKDDVVLTERAKKMGDELFPLVTAISQGDISQLLIVNILHSEDGITWKHVQTDVAPATAGEPVSSSFCTDHACNPVGVNQTKGPDGLADLPKFGQCMWRINKAEAGSFVSGKCAGSHWAVNLRRLGQPQANLPAPRS